VHYVNFNIFKQFTAYLYGRFKKSVDKFSNITKKKIA